MTRQELRVFLDEWFCGCGARQDATARLRDLLALHPLHSSGSAINTLLPDEGVRYLLLYTLDQLNLTEHGGSIGGAWLTDKGTAVLEALNRETADDFKTLNEGSCSHGYSIDTAELLECKECATLNVSH